MTSNKPLIVAAKSLLNLNLKLNLTLPSTDDNLMLHILHAHLQVMLWKAAGQGEPPAEARDITTFGWAVANGGAVMLALAIQADELQ